MTDPTADEMRRHRAKIHNQLVRMSMDICVKSAAGSILFGLFAPFYGQPAAAWMRSALLVTVGLVMQQIARYLARYLCSED